MKEFKLKPTSGAHSDLETDSGPNDTQIPTWIKKELNDAEILMIGGLGLTKKLNKSLDTLPLIPSKEKKVGVHWFFIFKYHF